MPMLKSFLRNSLITLVATMGLNYFVQAQDLPKETVQEQVEILPELNYSPTIDPFLNHRKSMDRRNKVFGMKKILSEIPNTLDKIKTVEQKVKSEFDPFSKMKKAAEKKQSIIQNIERTVNIGVAHDSKVNENFLDAVSEANILLKNYGLKNHLNENVIVKLPYIFNEKDFVNGIKYSFSSPQDIYFVLTDSEDRLNQIKPYIDEFANSNVKVIDATKDSLLEKTIRNFVLSSFSKTQNYDEIRNNLFKTLNDDKSINIKEEVDYERIVPVNIALDGTSIERANEIMEGISKAYAEKDKKIVFYVVDMFDHELPLEWKTLDQMWKIRDKETNKTQVHFLFTDRDWSSFSKDGNNRIFSLHDESKVDSLKKILNEDGVSTFSYSQIGLMAGMGNKMGYMWVETFYPIEQVISIAVHEFAHVLGAGHLYLEDANLHSICTPGKKIWAPKTIETIQKNRFNDYYLPPREKF